MFDLASSWHLFMFRITFPHITLQAFTNSRSWNDGNMCHGCLHDISRKDLSYPHKLHPPPGCRNVQRCCHRSWCRGYRGPASFPGQSTCPPHTPHTACRGPTHSLTACRGLRGTWCRAHTAVTGCSCSSHTCKCMWRRWSRCTVFSWRGDPCILCRADTYLCGYGFLRTFHLKRQKKKLLNKYIICLNEGFFTQKWDFPRMN